MTVREQLTTELEELKNEYRALTLEIPRDEEYFQTVKRLQLQGHISGIEYALDLLNEHHARITADLEGNI